MARVKSRKFPKNRWHWLLILFFVWFLIALWPVKTFLWPGHWWGNSLIVVMNDSEARPCGGFATAYGVLRLPIFKLDVGSTYDLDTDLGENLAPLKQVSERLHFWDLGRTPHLEKCTQSFAAGYQANSDRKIKRVILLQTSFLERWATVVGKKNFFANMSRSVADVDHHDEDSLANRKNPAGSMLRSLIFRSLNPIQWRQTTALIRQAERDKTLYWQGKSKFKMPANLVQISEWNLGGGKSSRYLRKSWSVDVQEWLPNDFSVTLRIDVSHLGANDGPLSQVWKGGFTFNFLDLGVFIPAEIAPGKSWHFEHSYRANLEELKKLHLYAPPYQNWQTKFSFSAFPQQPLRSKTLATQESVGTWSGILPTKGLSVDWSPREDETAPFLTLHKPFPMSTDWQIEPAALPPFLASQPDIDLSTVSNDIRTGLDWKPGDLVVELQFNEAIDLDAETLTANLEDRDFAVADRTENLELKGLHHLNLTTLLLNFEQAEYQTDERFYLSVNGVTDVWGNPYANEKRTVITR